MSDIVDELMHVQFVQYAEYRNGWTSRTLAKKAADEITRLNRELADARNAALEEAAARADSKCSYLRTNEMYPAYGLNSQVQALESIAAAIRSLKEKAE